MEQNVQPEWNKWYWTNLTLPAIKKIISVCKTSDKNFCLTATEEDFIPLLKYLITWEEKNSMIRQNIKNELEIIRSIKNYEQIIAA